MLALVNCDVILKFFVPYRGEVLGEIPYIVIEHEAFFSIPAHVWPENSVGDLARIGII